MRRVAKGGVKRGGINHVAREAEYDPAYHPARIFELWRDGLSNIASLCAELGIREDTIRVWIAEYPLFAEQYHLGRVHAKASWLDHGKDNLCNKAFQFKTYEQLLGHTFPELRERRPVSIKNLRKAKTLEQKIQVLADLMEEGFHSPEELTLMCSAVSKLAEMGTYQQIYDQVTAVEEKNKILVANKGAVIEGDVYKPEELPSPGEPEKNNDPTQT